MRTINKSPSGLLAAIIAVALVFIGATLYEHGIIDEEIYLKLLSAAKSEVVNENDLEVHFIDVDQAECILIKSPDKTVLIDSGDIGYEKTIENYLRTKGVFTIDLFILTHPHSDHIGSASEILEKFPVSEVILPKIPEEFVPTTSVFEKLLLTISKKNCKFSYSENGKIYDLGEGISLEILGPAGYKGDNLNNYSIVSKLTFGETSFIFTGDAETEAEILLLDSGADVSCTVFNAGHHGSSTSNSALFLKAANPEYAAISCGYKNDYGHPHREVISSFNDFGIEYYRTDYDGSIVFYSDGKNITVSKKK